VATSPSSPEHDPTDSGEPGAPFARPQPARLVDVPLRKGVYILPNLITTGGLFCGFYSVIASLRGDFLIAAVAIMAANLFDVLDGRIARWRHRASAMGRELDSLADVISFGVAPATLGFAAGMRGGLDAVILVYFVCCGVSRLARYNVTAETLSEGSGKVKYFEGTPIPTSVAITGVLAYCAYQGYVDEILWGGAWQIGPWVLHPLALLFGLSGTLMISKTLHIPKL